MSINRETKKKEKKEKKKTEFTNKGYLEFQKQRALWTQNDQVVQFSESESEPEIDASLVMPEGPSKQKLQKPVRLGSMMLNLSKWVEYFVFFEFQGKFDENTLYETNQENDLKAEKLEDLYYLSYPTYTTNLEQNKKYYFSFVINQDHSELYCTVLYDPSAKSISSSKEKEKENEKENEGSEEKEGEDMTVQAKGNSKTATKDRTKTNTEETNQLIDELINSSEDEESNSPVQGKEKKTENKSQQDKMPAPEWVNSMKGCSFICVSKYPFHQLHHQILIKFEKPIFRKPTRIDNGLKLIEKCFPKTVKMGNQIRNLKLAQKAPIPIKVPGVPKHLFTNSTETLCSLQYTGISSDLFQLFKPFLKDIWKLWTILITGQPLIVYGNESYNVSQVVLFLRSFIYPLEFAGKCYPLITRMDSQFKVLKNIHRKKSKNPRIILFGTTDYDLANSFSKWDNLLILSDPPQKDENEKRTKKKQSKKQKKKKIPTVGLKTSTSELIQINKEFLLQFNSKNNELSEGKKILLFREYIFNLTRTFRLPFERYFSTLTPDIDEIVPFYKVPILKGFSEKEFIEKLLKSQLGRTFNKKEKENQSKLYRTFIHTNHFLKWYQYHRNETGITFKKYYRDILYHISPETLIQNKTDLEIIDLLLRIETKLSNAFTNKDYSLAQSFISKIETLIKRLPSDLTKNFVIKLEQSQSKLLKKQNLQENKLQNENQSKQVLLSSSSLEGDQTKIEIQENKLKKSELIDVNLNSKVKNPEENKNNNNKQTDTDLKDEKEQDEKEQDEKEKDEKEKDEKEKVEKDENNKEEINENEKKNEEN
ncbi:hypothetical protein M0812_23475 [Anaeramoeba flamelloides]|uniref:UDENN domain-containing protein n=1 Tax=Anaeramoeba flamelloides TaxID=1746091 RepID=A0AAV7YKU4_9EUKA|nr:hypothetical protein M0812_23475 [Anaeramoeba flamelloides]